MNVIDEFSRFANLYDKHNIIQIEVAKKLVSMIDKEYYRYILDIGCGSGAVYKSLLDKNISFEKFIGADLSKEMLRLHPSSYNIQKISFDFDNPQSFKQLDSLNYDIVISSSALQWSKNLDMSLKEISKLSNRFYFSFFTSNTFKTLHNITNLQSPIYSKDTILEILNRYYTLSYEVVEYKLYFDSVYKMLRYIKQSGVSGGKKRLSYKETKKLIANYPLEYLEFEVLFVLAKKETK